jgi:hypothetical protein
MANKLPSVSILTVGEAKGHDLLIDQTSLEQALAVAQTMKRIKVTMGHGAQVDGILGYIDGFVIKGDRLMGDLTLFSTTQAQFVQQLAKELPEGFGLSLTFSGVPAEVGGNRYARVDEIFDISVVSSPAANSAGLFSAFTAVDIQKLQMIEAPIVEKIEAAPVVEVIATPEVAPVVAALAEAPAATPDAPVETKAAEPTLVDIAAMLTELLGLMKVDAASDITEEPAMDMAKKEVAAMSAVIDEKTVITLEKAKTDSAGAEPIPAESAQPVGRGEILNQFNQEKDGSKRVKLLRKLGL